MGPELWECAAAGGAGQQAQPGAGQRGTEDGTTVQAHAWATTQHLHGYEPDQSPVHPGRAAGVADALANGARPATMGERTMGGVVLVAADDLPDPESLNAWVGPAVARAKAKPAKS